MEKEHNLPWDNQKVCQMQEANGQPYHVPYPKRLYPWKGHRQLINLRQFEC